MTDVTPITRRRNPIAVEAETVIKAAAPNHAELTPNQLDVERQKLEQTVKDGCATTLKELGLTAKRTEAVMKAVIQRRDTLLVDIDTYFAHLVTASEHCKIVQESMEHVANFFPETKDIRD